MTGPEVADLSIQAYRNVGWQILQAIVLPSLLCLAVVAFALKWVFPGLFETSSTQASNVAAQLSEVVTALGLTIVLGGPLFLIGLSYSLAVTCSVVGDYMVGNVIDIKEAHDRARSCLWRLMWISFRTLLSGTAGYALCIVLVAVSAYVDYAMPQSDLPILTAILAILAFCVGCLTLPIILIKEALAVPACVQENLKASTAMKRGRALIKGKRFISGEHMTVAGLFVATSFVAMAIIFGVQIVYSIVGSDELVRSLILNNTGRELVKEALNLVPMFIALWTLIPVWCTMVTVLYYERRITLEGYDIETLAYDIQKQNRKARFEL